MEFTMLDILPTFALLLGRPWFHPLGGVSSTLHQKIKFPLDGKVATIEVETNILIACMNMTPPAFQVSMISEEWISPKVTTMMKKMSYELGTGLKKKKNGILKLPNFKGKTKKQGLGYNPTMDKGKKTTFISKGLSRY